YRRFSTKVGRSSWRQSFNASAGWHRCNAMSQPQRHAGHRTCPHIDVVLPVRSHARMLRPDIVEALADSDDPEVAIPIGTQRMRRLAICRLPKDGRKRHGSTLAVEYDSIQNAFGRPTARVWGDEQ